MSAKKHPGVRKRWEWATQAPQLKRRQVSKESGGTMNLKPGKHGKKAVSRETGPDFLENA